MRFRIYVLTSDTEIGMQSLVFHSERSMFEALVDLHDLTEEDKAEAFRLLEDEGEDQFLEFLEDRRGHFDTFTWDSHVFDTDQLKSVEQVRAEEGWHVYQTGGSRFQEDIEKIARLCGSICYEWEQEDDVFYVRRLG